MVTPNSKLVINAPPGALEDIDEKVYSSYTPTLAVLLAAPMTIVTLPFLEWDPKIKN